MEVVPMGVYYNISKYQPHWINLEPSTCQRLNQVHRNVMLAAITFNVATIPRAMCYTWAATHGSQISSEAQKDEQKSSFP